MLAAFTPAQLQQQADNLRDKLHHFALEKIDNADVNQGYAIQKQIEALATELKKIEQQLANPLPAAAQAVLQQSQRQQFLPEIHREDGLAQYPNATRHKLLQELKALEKLDDAALLHHPESILKITTLAFSSESLRPAEKLLKRLIRLFEATDKHICATAYFNLFHIYTYPQSPKFEAALEALNAASRLDRRYLLQRGSRYRLLAILGTGASGCAFRAHDQISNNPVVIKSLWQRRKALSTDDLFNEARLLAPLKHPHICQIIDWGFADEIAQKRAFFVFEQRQAAIDGECWLSQQGALTLDEVLAVAAQLTEALLVVRDQQIHHLDIKPANLLLWREEGQIQASLIDFGLSAIAQQVLQPSANHHGQTTLCQQLQGTPNYAAPEQTHEPSEKADVYALAKTLYRLCSHKIPIGSIRISHLPDGEYKREFHTLLEDCVEYDKDDRPSLAALMQQLQAWIAVDKPAEKLSTPPFNISAPQQFEKQANGTVMQRLRAWIAADKPAEKLSAPPFNISAPQQFEKQADDTVYDPRTGIYWQTQIEQLTWHEATEKAQQDTDGWRLPTRLELASLLDWNKQQAAIDSAVFPNTPSTVFWCQESAAWADDRAWQVNFKQGWSRTDTKTDKAYVRWLKGGCSVPTPRFQDMGNDTVLDHYTGLSWTRYCCAKNGDCGADSAEAMDWAAAKKAAKACQLADTSWRLPTQIELLSLVDLSQFSPAIDTAFFVSGQADWVCSATPWAGTGGVAWNVLFDYGGGSSNGSYEAWRVRLVRGGQ